MRVDTEKLTQYRDLTISRDELLRSGRPASVEPHLETRVEVCAEHVIGALEAYRDGRIDVQTLQGWVDTLWFSDWYEYCPEHFDSISSVMNELEALDEVEDPRNELDRKVDKYVRALKLNVEA